MRNLTPEQQQEFLDNLGEIQTTLCEAINELARLVDQVGDENARAYLLAPLQIHADADHGYISRDLNLTTWRERLIEEWNAAGTDEGEEDDEE